MNGYEVELIPLDQLQPNPYQTRDGEDPDHVAHIAASIKERGLLQPAVGRRAADSVVQLALGHTRLAAFRLLSEQDPGQYAALPVRIQDLTDLQMFEYAVAENHDRKDLSPIELARAMHTYQTTWRKSSKQVGQLFGMDGATVRNYLRLLNLPEPVQEHVGAGEISQATARKLLTLQNLAPGNVESVAKALADGSRDTPLSEKEIDSRVHDGLRSAKNAVEMWERWQHGEPRGGSGLWELATWTPADSYQAANAKALLKDFPQWEQGLADQTDSPAELVKEYIEAAQRQVVAGRPIREYLTDMACPADLADLIATIVLPPVCAKCPYYARVEGNHYCGIKLCHTNKKKAWMEAELLRVHRETGVAIYDDPKVDGKVYEEASERVYETRDGHWGSYPTPYAEWWAADPKPDHLRLVAKAYSGYSDPPFTGSKVVRLISVRPELAKEKAKEQQEEAKRKQAERDAEGRRNLEQMNRSRSQIFFERIAAPVFARVFDDLPAGVVQVVARAFTAVESMDVPDDARQADRFRRELLAFRILRDQAGEWELVKQGPVAVAEHLQGLATEMGLALPEDWLAIAGRVAAGQDPGRPLAEVLEDEDEPEDTGIPTF